MTVIIRNAIVPKEMEHTSNIKHRFLEHKSLLYSKFLGFKNELDKLNMGGVMDFPKCIDTNIQKSTLENTALYLAKLGKTRLNTLMELCHTTETLKANSVDDTTMLIKFIKKFDISLYGFRKTDLERLYNKADVSEFYVNEQYIINPDGNLSLKLTDNIYVNYYFNTGDEIRVMFADMSNINN